METALRVAHTQKQDQILDTACRDQGAGSSIASTNRDGCCSNWAPPRRACPFLITGSATISVMTTLDRGETPRVPVLVRLPVPTRDGLRCRAALERASMSRHLEGLIERDLDGSPSAPFVAVTGPTFTSRGKNGTGRPTKGARATVMLRIEPSLRARIHQRAHSLQLTVIDYLESLVSQDISAAATLVGEEMTFDQTA